MSENIVNPKKDEIQRAVKAAFDAAHASYSRKRLIDQSCRNLGLVDSEMKNTTTDSRFTRYKGLIGNVIDDLVRGDALGKKDDLYVLPSGAAESSDNKGDDKGNGAASFSNGAGSNNGAASFSNGAAGANKKSVLGPLHINNNPTVPDKSGAADKTPGARGPVTPAPRNNPAVNKLIPNTNGVSAGAIKPADNTSAQSNPLNGSAAQNNSVNNPAQSNPANGSAAQSNNGVSAPVSKPADKKPDGRTRGGAGGRGARSQPGKAVVSSETSFDAITKTAGNYYIELVRNKKALTEKYVKALKISIRECLAVCSSEFFEEVCVKIVCLVYKTAFENGKITGGYDDNGIDGVVRFDDELGFHETVYIQAKCRERITNSSTLTEIKSFWGSVPPAEDSSKALFMTNGAFHSLAADFADKNERLKAIDGDHLAQLMIDYCLGVKYIDGIPVIEKDFYPITK
jgi:restriction system protein